MCILSSTVSVPFAIQVGRQDCMRYLCVLYIYTSKPQFNAVMNGTKKVKAQSVPIQQYFQEDTNATCYIDIGLYMTHRWCGHIIRSCTIKLDKVYKVSKITMHRFWAWTNKPFFSLFSDLIFPACYLIYQKRVYLYFFYVPIRLCRHKLMLTNWYQGDFTTRIFLTGRASLFAWIIAQAGGVNRHV